MNEFLKVAEFKVYVQSNWRARDSGHAMRDSNGQQQRILMQAAVS